MIYVNQILFKELKLMAKKPMIFTDIKDLLN